MKFLIISENEELSNQISKLITANNAKTNVVINKTGRSGLERVTNGEIINAVIIDATLKDEDPLEIAESILELLGERPFIFLGETKIVQQRINKELIPGVDLQRIILLPLSMDNFNTTIKWALKWTKEAQFTESVIEMSEDDCLPIKVKNFYLFNEVPYNVYLRVTQKKYGIIIYKNNPYYESVIQKYIKKNVKFFYLLKEDRIRFLEESVEKFNLFFASETIKDLGDIIKLQTGTASAIHEYLRVIGVTDVILELINNLITSCMKTFDEVKDIKKIIKLINFSTCDLGDQSVIKFYICESILNGLGWNADLTRKKLAIVSIIHDYALENENLSKIYGLDDPNLKMFTASEQENFNTHLVQSADLSKHFNDFTEVDFIISQHHELPNGTGFPHGHNGFKIAKISAIFILASNLVTKLVHMGNRKGMLELIITEFSESYKVGSFKEPLIKLIEVFFNKNP